MEQEYKNILVGIDGSEQALSAFKKQLRLLEETTEPSM